MVGQARTKGRSSSVSHIFGLVSSWGWQFLKKLLHITKRSSLLHVLLSLQKYLSADSEGDGPLHILLRVDFIGEAVGANPRNDSIAIDSHSLMSIAEHGCSFGEGRRNGVKFIASEW